MSQTGIGKTGQVKQLTSPQDDALFLFNSTMWCTHPLLGNGFMNSNDMDIVSGSTLVEGSTTRFTALCNNFDNSNIPLNKYIAYENGGGGYGILEVDYVIDDLTLILKTPAFETANISAALASQINQFGTPILNEVRIQPLSSGSGAVALTLGNKYFYNPNIVLFDHPYSIENEGGVEPQLALQENVITSLYY